MKSGLAVLVRALVMALSTGVAAAAELNAVSKQLYDIEIAPQNVADALNRLAEQTGAVMLFPYDLAKSRSAQAVSGRYSVMEALAKLLEGSGLSSGLSDRSVIQITVVTAEPRTTDEGKDTMRAPARNRLLGLIGLAASAAATDTQAQAPAEPAFGVEEVIVSSRRREESLQATPISVTARTGDDLISMGVRNFIELGNFVPNVMTLGSGIGPAVGAFYLRGIGSGRSGIDDEPPVGLYLDGVFLGSFDGSLLQVIKPKRVEVLRGPQGTLFGKNALGGAVQYISQEPLTTGFDGELEVTSGSFNRLDATSYVNIPLGADKAVRITAASFNRDGVVDARRRGTKVNDIGTNFVRADFLWSMTPDFTARLAVDYAAVDNNGSGNVLQNVDYTDTRANRYRSRGFDLRTGLTGDPYANTSTSPTFIDSMQGGVALTLDWDLGENVSLKSITAYRETNMESWIDRDATPFLYFEQIDDRKHDQVTQEFQFIYGSEKLDWIFGLYAFDENPSNDRQRLEEMELGNARLREVFTEDNQSYAAFTEGTYNIDEVWSLTVGARYTYEEKQTSTLSYREGAIASAVFADNQGDFDAFSPRVVLQAQWTPELMTYLSYAEGFKSGGFNTRYNPMLPANGFIPYDEEVLTNYEFGLRSEWFDRRLRFNISFFESDYSDLQITQLAVLDTLLVTNGGAAKLEGFELEGVWMPTESIQIDYGAGYLDTYYTDIGRAQDIIIGESIGSTPKVSYNLAAQYTHQLVGGSQLVSRLSYGWKEGRFLGNNETSRFQPSYGLLTGRVEYRDGSGRWRVTAFGTNLADERYLVQSQFTRGIDMAVFNDPREYGVTFAYSF